LEYRRGLINLLTTALDDQDSTIRRHAASEAVSHARALAHVNLVDEAIRLLQIVLDRGEFDERRVWEAARAIANQERAQLSPNQTAQLETLTSRVYGDNLADQVRRYTAKRSWVDWPSAGFTQQRPEEVAAQLADEAFHSVDVLVGLLPWLSSNEAEGVWPFGQRLGELDSERGLFELLAEAAYPAGRYMFLCAYLSGRTIAGDSDWVASLVDDWARSAESSELAVEATVRLKGTDQALIRLFAMIDAGNAEPSILNWTIYGRWLENVSVHLQTEAIERLTRIGNEGMEGALSIMQDLLTRERSVPEELFQLAWDLLAIEEPSASTMSAYYWGEIGRVLLEDSPEKVAGFVLAAFLRDMIPPYDERMELLAAALERQPANTWNVIAQALLDSEEAYKLIWEIERLGIVDSVPLEVLDKWLDVTEYRGGKILAQATKPKPGVNDALVELLLRRFPDLGDDLEINYWTGGYTGPESLRVEELINEASAWSGASSPLLRTWSARVIQNLTEQRDTARAREALE
jgi:hypothetical protein